MPLLLNGDRRLIEQAAQNTVHSLQGLEPEKRTNVGHDHAQPRLDRVGQALVLAQVAHAHRSRRQLRHRVRVAPPLEVLRMGNGGRQGRCGMGHGRTGRRHIAAMARSVRSHSLA